MIRIDLGKDSVGNLEKKQRTGLIRHLPLPDQIKDYLQENLRFVIAMIFGATLALAPIFMLGKFKTGVRQKHRTEMKQLKAEIKAYKREIAALKPFQNELKSYEAQKKKVAERLGIVQNLLFLRKTPVPLLDSLGQSLPKKTWLENVKVQFVDEESISIKGNAFANEEVSDYVDRLGDSIYFSNVALSNLTTRKLSGDIDVRSFEIKARVASTPGNQ